MKKPMYTVKRQLNMKRLTNNSLRSIRSNLILFIVGLFLSGITAFPIQSEIELIIHCFPSTVCIDCWYTPIHEWLNLVLKALTETNEQYPFLAYGTDWLAFAHVILAVLFIGPYLQPKRNVWVIEFGMIACAGIFPLAFIAGAIRQIPLFHQFIDCLFGVFGLFILIPTYFKIKKLKDVPSF